MNKLKYIMVLITTFIWLSSATLYGQSQELQQLALNYEKLRQFRAILKSMHDGYRILTKGYNTIRDIAEGNFNLHELFLDGLYLVSPAVKNYERIPRIIRCQQFILSEGRRAYRQFRNDSNLTLKEIRYIEDVYSSLVSESLRNLDQLIMVITAAKLRMSDEERLQAIDRIFHDMQSKVTFLKMFNSGTQVLIVQRAKEKHNINTLQKLHAVEQ